MENAVQIIELLIEIYEKKRGDDEISFFPFYFPPRTFLRAFIAAALFTPSNPFSQWLIPIENDSQPRWVIVVDVHECSFIFLHSVFFSENKFYDLAAIECELCARAWVWRQEEGAVSGQEYLIFVAKNIHNSSRQAAERVCEQFGREGSRL